MGMCALGSKKLKKIETIVNSPVKQALVRGGWEHFWASVTLTDGRNFMVNYKTGEIEPSRFAGFELSGNRMVGPDGLPVALQTGKC